MRTIKFRAWDDFNKEMIDYLAIDEQGWIFSSKTNSPFVMQFTGLLDKNGKEIYEGDVVRTPNGDWGVIQYEPPFFGVTVSANSVSHYRRDWLESCEVIGNVWENRGLVEDNQ